MTSIKRISVSNFKSFSEFDLEVPPPGLYLITGLNEADDEIGANGAGKTTIIDAFSWGLVGKTSGGSSGPTVESRIEKGPVRVDIDMEDGSLSRTRDPIAVFRNGDKANEGTILEEFQYLINIAVHGQFMKTLLDMSPADKMSFLDEIVDTSHWEYLSGQARARATDASRDVMQSEGRLGSLEKEVEVLKGKIDAAIKLRSESGVEQMIEDAEKKRERLLADWEKMDADREDAEREVELGEKAIIDLREHEDKTSNVRHQVSSRLDAVNKELDMERNVIRAIKGWDGKSRCPTCYSVMDPKGEGAKREIAARRSAIKELEKRAKGLEDDLDAAEKSAATASERRKSSEDNLAKWRDKLKKVTAAQSGNATEGRQVRELIDRLKADLEESKTRVSTLSEIEHDREEGIKVEKKALKKAQRRRDRNQYWTGGFREIRLLVVERSLEMIAGGINRAIHDLGLKGWAVEFNAGKLTKTGDLSRKLHTMVRTPTTPEGALWSELSGGELQRLRVAAAAAVSDFISAAHGTDINIEFFDEPCCHLSGLGDESLLDFLDRRAAHRQRAIFVVEHTKPDYPFAGEYNVVKNKRGISRLS